LKGRLASNRIGRHPKYLLIILTPRWWQSGDSHVVAIAPISLRLPESMLEEIKLLANKRDVPYQSLMKILLSKTIKEELGTQ